VKTGPAQVQRNVTRERRVSARASCLAPLRFFELSGQTSKLRQIANSKNVSKTGIKITCMAPLARHQILVLQLDPMLLNRYLPKEGLIFVSKDKVLAEVVWRKLKLETGLFEIGLQFISANRRKELETAIKEAERLEEKK
jgi:hypothetical protein